LLWISHGESKIPLQENNVKEHYLTPVVQGSFGRTIKIPKHGGGANILCGEINGHMPGRGLGKARSSFTAIELGRNNMPGL
jgi:hypothetical protein